MAYLLKITLAWALFLLLFELFYKNNGKFIANRIYLLASIGLGLLIPFIPLPAGTPKVIATTTNATTTQALYLPFTPPVQQSATPGCAPAAPAIQAPEQSIHISSVIGIIYLLGAVVLLIKCLAELYKMLRFISRSSVQMLHGQKVIVTGKIHAPYSFSGYIFITDTTSYNAQELQYIIRHEAAHNNRKHSIDLWLIQLACIAFWFHPLIWRYRYLLQMQHEYEADAVAANNDAYNYGCFLLQQTLLNGVPFIAHSFHFSPIKNRINMLTQKNSLKAGNWKYILLAPALLGCTFLMAKGTGKTECAPVQNAITYDGNTFAWRETDTMYVDKITGKVAFMPMSNTIKWTGIRDKKQIIYKMNDEAVYQNETLEKPAGYKGGNGNFYIYVDEEFQKLSKNTADSLTLLGLINLVIDKEGNLVLCTYKYGRRDRRHGSIEWSTAPNATVDGIMKKLLAEAAKWKPAIINGRPVNATINSQGGC